MSIRVAFDRCLVLWAAYIAEKEICHSGGDTATEEPPKFKVDS